MKNERGFTLIELIVVLSIIAIFTAAIFTTYGQVLEKEQQLRIAADKQLLQVAASQYAYAQEQEIYGEISQAELIQAGYLTAVVDSPWQDRQYQIILQGRQVPIVELMGE